MIHGIKTLDDVNVKNKRVLIRLDLNSDIRKGKLIPSERLTAPIKTLKELKNKGARIVIIAHQGRPGSNDFTSLEQHAKYLNKFIKIKFVKDVIGKRAITAINNLKPGEILLLDNIRNIKDETEYKKDKHNSLIRNLSPFFDVFINDAFSASHREHASIVGFPKHLESATGRVFEAELKAVQNLKMSDALYVLGGSKPEDNVLLTNKNNILASGLFGPFCIMATGKKLGKQNKIMSSQLKQYGSMVKKNKKNIVLPIDLAVEHKGKRLDLGIQEFPKDKEILDLGIKTIEDYARMIVKAKTVFFKGLVGLCNKPEFTIGTKALLMALAECKGFTLVSGGHTLTMIDKLKIPKSKFSYISLSGGALIHYLSKGTIAGIEALKHK